MNLDHYKFCSMCGGGLKRKGLNLRCTKCDFVNYQNARPTATAIIMKGNKVLLVKRAEEPYLGWWDLPAGYVGRGESPEDTLRREMKEELGISIKFKKFLGTYPGTATSGPDRFYILSLVYLITPVGTPKVVDKKEVQEFTWFSKNDFPKRIAFDSNRDIVRDFLKIWK